MSLKKKMVLPVLILVCTGFACFLLMKSGKNKIRKQAGKPAPPLVRVQTVSLTDYQVIVEGHGTTRPRYELPVSSPVGGQVRWVDPGLVPGGHFKKGDILFKLDPTDYLVAWEDAKYQLASAEHDLKVATANQKSAVSARELSGSREINSNSAFSTLALHEPQMKKARAFLQLAKAKLEQAKRNLERTNVTAPFAGFIAEAKVSEGQILNRGQEAAKLLNNDTLLVEVSVSLDEYQWLQPALADGESRPKANLTRAIDSKTHTWHGQVIETMPGLDPVERQMVLLIEITGTMSDLHLKMPTGMFVKALIQGEFLKDVYRLPGEALRADNQILVVSDDSQLRAVTVNILYQNGFFCFRSGALQEGDRVLISPSPGLKAGMQVQAGAPGAAERRNL